MEKFNLGSQNTVSKYNQPTQVLAVLVSCRVRVEGVESFYGESESKKGFCWNQSRKKDFAGVGSRSQSRKIYARLSMLHKNLIKNVSYDLY